MNRILEPVNPFPRDPDRGEIWDMLVRRDTGAFLEQDWEAVRADFIEEGFFGVDCALKSSPDSWRLAFPDLASYRVAWLRQAEQFARAPVKGDRGRALFDATTLRDIDIAGDAAAAHKKFDGWLEMEDGTRTRMLWQTVYACRRVSGRWKIASFIGYLPHGSQEVDRAAAGPGKRLPAGASQHVTAGPYSPVLEVDAGRLVVISGQAAIDTTGKVVGETIEEQTRFTLQNCRDQLGAAGCSLADVFKVIVYMADLAEWDRMNAVYREVMPEPRPVRTAVGARLLLSLKVEIEMWAVKGRQGPA